MFAPLETFKALSDMNRLRIVAALDRGGELCACQITELLQVAGATASRHLGILQHAGLVESRKEGRWIHYRLSPLPGTEAVLAWLGESYAQSPQLKVDAQVLERIVAIGREELCRKQRGR